MTDDLDRLRLLHAVGRAGTIAAAAREVGFTASAVSQQLAALERRVGVTLLERSNRGVVLTPAGAVLTERAGALLDQLQADLAEARDVAGAPARSPIRVAAFPTAVASVLLPAVRSAAAAGDRLHVVIVHLEPEAATAALLDRTVDIAVVDRDDLLVDPLPAGLVHDRLLRDHLRLVTPVGAGPDVTVEDLGDHPWVLGTRSSRLGRLGRAICHRHGIDPTVVAETDDHHLAFRIAAAVGAATIQPGMALVDLPTVAGPEDPALAVVEEELGVARTIDLVVRPLPRPDPAIAGVVRALRAAAAARP